MVTGKAVGRTSRRIAWISALLAGLVTAAFAATPAWAGKIHGKLRGTVDVPGGSLALPVSSNVTITLFLGGPSGPPLPITITPNTKVEAEDAKEKVSGSGTLGNGDPIEVRGKLQGGQIVATKIKLLGFFQIEGFGTVDVPPPGAGGSLTLPASSNVTITVFLGGADGPPLPVVITPNTKVRGTTPLILQDNNFIEFKAVVQSGQVVAVKIRLENVDEVEDE